MEEFKPSGGLQASHSFVFKQVGNTPIRVDIFLPERSTASNDKFPVLLFIHGGAWIGGHREEYCRPLIQDFLSRGSVVVSTDYRLIPESQFVEGQLEDIRDVGKWIRQDLSGALESCGFRFRCGRLIVAGASAGALLALLTPKLWDVPPAAILSIYGPTNMPDLPYRAMGPLAQLDIDPPDSEILEACTNYDNPPTQTPKPKSPAEWLSDRTKMGIHMFRTESVTALLLRGLERQQSSAGISISFPKQADISKEEIDQISPLSLCKTIRYPPVYQIMGSVDSVFAYAHVTELAAELEKQGVPHAEHIVQGADHAFDMSSTFGDTVHLEVTRPAVDWLLQFQ